MKAPEDVAEKEAVAVEASVAVVAEAETVAEEAVAASKSSLTRIGFKKTGKGNVKVTF